MRTIAAQEAAMSVRRTTSRSLSVVTLVAVLGLLVSACGSSDSSPDTATEPGATASSAPSGGTGPGGPGGFDQEQLDAIQKCLEAAGLGDTFPSDLPTDQPSGLPSGFPTDGGTPPSGFPTDGTPPTGAPGQGGPGGGFGAFDDPEVQAALQACGIELPTGRPSTQPSS
jgi:hypothetical protein